MKLTEEDKVILSNWFGYFLDRPLTVSEIISSAPNAFTNSLLLAFDKDGKIDSNLFTQWLYFVRNNSSFEYMLETYISPYDGIKKWCVVPNGAFSRE